MTTEAPPRVLIVEDDPDTVELLAEQLEDAGYEVRFAEDGERAILMLGSHEPPDVILMDFMMPRLDGPETTRYIKARFANHFVPVMMLTAKGDQESIGEGIRMGVDEYTTKPYSGAILRQRVEQLLKLRRAEQARVDAGEKPGPETEAVVEQRLTMARNFSERGLYDLARRYLIQNTTYIADHEPSLVLLSEIAGKD